MSKRDFRIYCDEEYLDHLKTVADENGVSVSQLVLSLVMKKYPMPKKKKPQAQNLDLDAIRTQYDTLDKFITDAESGGPKIKPYTLYVHLQEERKRLADLLANSSQT